jgi:hypothetical protein
VSWYKLRALSDVDTEEKGQEGTEREMEERGLLTSLRNKFSVLEPAREEPANRPKG